MGKKIYVLKKLTSQSEYTHSETYASAEGACEIIQTFENEEDAKKEMSCAQSLSDAKWRLKNTNPDRINPIRYEVEETCFSPEAPTHHGLVRQIDDLGRIVIPKEIRRMLGAREGTSFSITTAGNKVILEPYRNTMADSVDSLIYAIKHGEFRFGFTDVKLATPEKIKRIADALEAAKKIIEE